MYGGEKYCMGEKSTYRHISGKLASGGGSIPSIEDSERPELTPELQKYMHVIGPAPKRCLETLADLGLCDDEIGRYFRMPRRFVTELRDIWKIDGKT